MEGWKRICKSKKNAGPKSKMYASQMAESVCRQGKELAPKMHSPYPKCMGRFRNFTLF